MATYKEVVNYRILKPGIGLSLLGCMFLFCLIVASLLIGLLPYFIERPESAIRIGTVVQDFMVFILPAIATALAASRLPARLLAVDRWAGWCGVLFTLLVMCLSVPAMNMVIEWNQDIHLPASMAALESQMRAMEEAAAASAEMLIGGTGIGSLIVSVMIVGVLAGFSEELFFRGALQRLLCMTRMNKHVAIWLTAFIFSAVHFQFFGFVPRMLLGAFFGYLLWWSGSLWLPVIAHIFNNTLVVISEYVSDNNIASFDIDSVGTTSVPLVIASLLLTIAGLWWLRRNLSEQQ